MVGAPPAATTGPLRGEERSERSRRGCAEGRRERQRHGDQCRVRHRGCAGAGGSGEVPDVRGARTGIRPERVDDGCDLGRWSLRWRNGCEGGCEITPDRGVRSRPCARGVVWVGGGCGNRSCWRVGHGLGRGFRLWYRRFVERLLRGARRRHLAAVVVAPGSVALSWLGVGSRGHGFGCVRTLWWMRRWCGFARGRDGGEGIGGRIGLGLGFGSRRRGSAAAGSLLSARAPATAGLVCPYPLTCPTCSTRLVGPEGRGPDLCLTGAGLPDASTA